MSISIVQVPSEEEPERWRQTEEAIEAAERGEVIPAEEVFAWLDTWGREGSALLGGLECPRRR